jgi:uncharacterized paraquat-inducible protein A
MRCRSCNAALPKRGARCLACGYAADLEQRRRRMISIGTALVLAGIFFGIIALAIVVQYVKGP